MLTRVYLENGKRWTFAAAVDWPGWVRRGKGEEAAIEALLGYAPRYAAAVGADVDAEQVSVIGRVAGTAITDFGAPDVRGPWDDEPFEVEERARQVALLRAGWDWFDRVVAAASPELRKGPRGGGRDRDDVARHVREAERGYAPKVGVRIAPRTPWPQQRDLIASALTGEPAADWRWPARYLIRRMAWHVLDHGWEIEDKSA